MDNSSEFAEFSDSLITSNTLAENPHWPTPTQPGKRGGWIRD